MNTQKLILTIITLGMLTGISLAAGPGDNRQRNEGRGPAFEQLDLTVEQRESMEELRRDQQLKAIDMRAKLEKQEIELQRLQREDNPNQKRIHAQIEKIGNTRIEMAKAKADLRLETRNLLTAEQQAQLKELRPTNRQGQDFGQGSMKHKPRRGGHPNRF